MDRRLSLLEDLVKSLSSRDPVHGWEHIERVRRLCRYIASRYGGSVDLEILDLAALLHDVGRFVGDGRHHSELSAEFAEKILRILGYGEDKISRVVGAITSHSYSYGREPETIEGKILSDADKIDAMGAVGVARTFMLGGLWGRGIDETLKHFEEKLLKLYGRLYLEVSREIARDRFEFLEKFYKQIRGELGVEV
ncbi:MAG: HD domain-containing protein [Sulfolobales archaeon]